MRSYHDQYVDSWQSSTHQKCYSREGERPLDGCELVLTATRMLLHDFKGCVAHLTRAAWREWRRHSGGTDLKFLVGVVVRHGHCAAMFNWVKGKRDDDQMRTCAVRCT